MKRGIKILFWLFVFIAITDIFVQQVWKIFPDTPITWHGNPDWTIQNVVYAIGTSFLFLLFYIFAWLVFYFTDKIHTDIFTRIADCISAGWVILALNDLWEECTGQNQSDTPWEWIGFGLIVVIRGFYIYRIIKWSKL